MYRYLLVSLYTLLLYNLSWANEDAPVFTLDTIEVTAEPIEETLSATRIALDPLDAPYSIDVIDEKIIDDQQANTVDEILKNDASISNRGNFGAMSSFSSRGFTLSDSGNYLRNGLPYFFFDTPPVESVQQVEILKGPASFLYGSGSPGGMINFLTKKPEDDNFVEGGAQTASWNYYRAYADLNKSTTEGNDYRLNVAYEDTKSFRDEYFRTRELVDLSMKTPFLPHTDTWFNITYQHTDSPQDTGLVAIGDSVTDLPRSAYLNQDWTKTELSSINATLDSHTDLINDWTLHSALYYQYVDRERILSNLRLTEDSTGDFQYSMQQRFDTWNYYTALFEVISEKYFLFNQKLLFGVTYDIMDHDILETDPIMSATYSIYDTPTLAEPDFGDFNDPINITTDNLGFYAQDVIELHKKLELIVGARFDTYASNSSELASSSANHTSPHAAIVYKPLTVWSIYTSYSEGFEFNESVSDSNAVNFGEALDPTLSEQIEVGSKLELWNNRLLLSAALFDILRYNQPITEDIESDDPSDVIVVQRGEQHHQGLELGAQGRITPAWITQSSLMWIDARFSENNAVDVAGNRPAAVPSLSATVWSQYRFINHYAINGGIFYEGKRFGDDQNSFVLDPYARLDAGVAYYYPLAAEKELVLRVNVENISDMEYFSAYRRSNVTVGAPRSVWFTFELER